LLVRDVARPALVVSTAPNQNSAAAVTERPSGTNVRADAGNVTVIGKV
jgi:hypothetical protein